MNKSILFFLSFCTLIVFGNDSLPIKRSSHIFYFQEQLAGLNTYSDSLMNQLEINGGYGSHSFNLPHAVPLNLLMKKDFSPQLKQRALDFPGKQITYEDDIKAGIRYVRYLKQKKWAIDFQYQWRTTRNLYASKDAYGVVFFGNSRFEDKTIDLEELRFSNYNYNKMGFGFHYSNDLKKEDRLGFGFHLDVLQGINVQWARNKSGGLYTAPDGEYLDLTYDLTLNIGREGAVRYTDWNGIGASSDFYINYEKKGKYRVQFLVQDLGALYFKKYAVNFSGADSIHFQGLVITDILNIGNQNFDSLNTDSILKSYLPMQTQKPFVQLVPFSMQLAYTHYFKERHIALTAGVIYKNYYRYYGYGFLKADFFVREEWIFSLSAGAGGYDLFNLGAQISRYWKHVYVTLGSNNLIGAFTSQYYPGGSVFFKIGGRF